MPAMAVPKASSKPERSTPASRSCSAGWESSALKGSSASILSSFGAGAGNLLPRSGGLSMTYGWISGYSRLNPFSMSLQLFPPVHTILPLAKMSSTIGLPGGLKTRPGNTLFWYVAYSQ
eukprot:1504534-Rhodomonas_salina.1